MHSSRLAHEPGEAKGAPWESAILAGRQTASHSVGKLELAQKLPKILREVPASLEVFGAAFRPSISMERNAHSMPQNEAPAWTPAWDLRWFRIRNSKREEPKQSSCKKKQGSAQSARKSLFLRKAKSKSDSPPAFPARSNASVFEDPPTHTWRMMLALFR